MSKQDQLMKNQKIQIMEIEYTKEEKAEVNESNALTTLVLAKNNLPIYHSSGVVTPRERE